MINRILVATTLAVTTGLAGTVHTQTFPFKPVRLVFPYPPGGAGDIAIRVLADDMAKGLGQPVIVDNRPGASASIGYALVARAPGDGYTILAVLPSLVTNPLIQRGLSYDPIRDFNGIGLAMSSPMAIAASSSLPAKSLTEVIALARAKPGEIAYGSSGAGGLHHIVGEMFRLAVNINILHVPYKGGPDSVIAVAGGQIPMVVNNAGTIAPYARNGKVRALVVTTPERAETLPDVPTFRESGYPELEATNWIGIVAPKATPASVIARLNAALVSALHNTEVAAKLKAQDFPPTPSTPDQFTALLRSEATRYSRIVREAGIKVD